MKTLLFYATLPTLCLAGLPEAVIKLDDDVLRATAGKPVMMKLQLPQREAWGAANIGQFQIRSFGKVETIVPNADQTTNELPYTFDTPGYAMVLIAAGPAASRGFTDSIQRVPYCAKLLVRVDPDPSQGADPAVAMKSPGLTAKAGLKTEVCPYIDPVHLRPAANPGGADLPVRLYFEGTSQAGATVTAYGPNDAQHSATSDSKGIAHLRISTAGRWVVRYEHITGGLTHTGDLVFEVRGNTSEDQP